MTDLQRLEEFVNRLQTQENLATARPLYIELQERKTVFVTGDMDFDEQSVASKCEELRADPEEIGIDPDEMLYWKYVWETQAVFLTHEGYDVHVRLNGHNYGTIRKYTKHAYRNPELVQVIAWLEELLTLKRGKR